MPLKAKKFIASLSAALCMGAVCAAPMQNAAEASKTVKAVPAQNAGKPKARLVPVADAKKADAQAVEKKSAQNRSDAKRRAAPQQSAKKTTAKKKASAKKTNVRRSTGSAPSQATLSGLRNTEDPLLLDSSVAYAVDQDTGEELIVKNAGVPLPIASVTKLMTALIIAESSLSLQEKIRITREDYVRCNAVSKLVNGMTMTRGALLQAALMSSDNRAAHALARTYPGGKKAFVKKMNERAAELGLADSVFVDPTGLDNANHSTARDLGKLVSAVYEHQEIRDASTAPAAKIRAGKRLLSMQTTNSLIGDPSWKIGIQKTGFTTAAGRCMVVQSKVGERNLVMVVLDSHDNSKRVQDMRTMRAFVEAEADFARDFSHALPYGLF